MALEAVVSVVTDKLLNFIIEEASSLRHVEDKVKRIQTELRDMQQFLQDADSKQHNNPKVKNWVNDIREVAFDVEDVFETYILKTTLQKRRNFVYRFAFKLNDRYTSRMFGKEIERIQNSIREISDRRSTYDFEAIGGGSGEASSSTSEKLREWRRNVARYDDENQVVGLENDVNALKARLIGEPSRRCVISIVGMGGSGKSTLAKKVYSCNEVKTHFECHVWVDVSQVFDAKDLLQDIAQKSMNLQKQDLQNMNEENLKEKINGFLTVRKYFVVMDDVWEFKLWNHLHTVFPDTNNGSRIIFTTRKKEVALHADPQSLPHELQPLSDSDSWELFIKKVLSVEEITVPEELEAVGKNIVEKCKGLPLAIVVLGGFLSRKRRDYGVWSKVLDSVSWQLNKDETPCSQILALSYNDLPSYLKSCFLYLGIFPEDHEISARNLMRLWVSEGFVKQRGNELDEDVAEEYLEQLVDRCMVQVAARRPTGSIKKCRIHDLLRDLAISKADEVEFFHIHPNPNSSSTYSPPLNKVRRVSVHKFSEKHFDKCIRSAFYFFSSDHETMYGAIHSSVDFEMLRVLHISFNGYLDTSEYLCLPKAIGKLIHLRYLWLRYVKVKKFSSIINKFRNLEFLDMKEVKISCARDAISKMDHLRYLNFGRWEEILLDPPRGNDSSSIRNLQTLQGILIDNKSVVKDGWDKYTNLRKLRLVGDLESQVEALSEWIAKLDRLESLSLDFYNKKEEKFKNPIERMNIFSRNNHLNINLFDLYLANVWIEKLPDPCEFPSNFSHLKLEKSIIGAEAIQTLGKLPKLKYLLIQYSALTGGKAIMFSSGAFPQLQQLKFCYLKDLEEWKVEEGAFPCLRELSIWNCKDLKALPDGLVHITTLLKFHVCTMSEEFNARVRPNVGEDWGKIAHVPNIGTDWNYRVDRKGYNVFFRSIQSP